MRPYSSRGKRAISPVMSELMMLALVAALGSMVFIFANISLGTFGTGFSLLINREGLAVSQQPVIEFVRFHGASRELISIFVRNVGTTEFFVERVVIQNITNAPPAGLFHSQTFTNLKVDPGTFQVIQITLGGGSRWQSGVTYRIVLITEQAVRVVENEKAA